MGLGKFAATCVVLSFFAGSFAIAHFFLQWQPSAGAEEPAASPAALKKVELPVTKPAEEEPKPPEPPKRLPETAKKIASRPFTCADAYREGRECIGRRVTWAGKRRLSQSARIDKKEGTQHIFYTQGPKGEFSFDFPFIAEDSKAMGPILSPKEMKEQRKKQWGSTGVVTVTGTISRLDTLMMIGTGTRYDVPVLRNITIKINP
ncbi:MAG: hypothetical protein ACJ8FY_06645 [Gemmataceae bacterium]